MNLKELVLIGAFSQGNFIAQPLCVEDFLGNITEPLISCTIIAQANITDAAGLNALERYWIC